MKLNPICLGTLCLAFFVLHASSAPLYVDLNSTNPVSPYSDWSIAATNIQDAIDASSDGDQIWVTNGIYQTGGRFMAGNLTNRVALNKAVTVQSVTGPWATIIQGAGAVNGTAAVRCAWLTNNAALIGFTLQWGATRTSGDPFALRSGGGSWCASSNAIVRNCVIVSNTASQYGGGVYQGTLNNCFISGNSGTLNSSGAYVANLNSCTVVSNGGQTICAISAGVLTNCIVYYNSGGNSSGSTFSYCCTTPLAGGAGNFTNAPQLFADGVHLTSTSPCIGMGVNMVSGTDIFGKAWANPPSVGCAEFDPSPLITQPQLQLTSDPVGFTVNSTIAASAPFLCWWLKGSVPLQDNGHFSFTQTTNLVATGVNFADAGNYQLVVSNAVGVVTSTVAQLVVHCVDVAGVNPIAPYSTWATAATNIQVAITASGAGEIVLVTNGLYAVGGKSMDGVITNRVSVDKAILVQSVNGPNTTIIQGAWDLTSTNGPGAVRCAWLMNNATLSGFTLHGGATRADINDSYMQLDGGGVFGVSNSIVANCTVKNNAAATAGGGVVGATLINCLLTDNSVLGVSGYGVDAVGGGTYNCSLKNCIVRGNYALSKGGGTAYSQLKNCAVTGNSAKQYSGGVYYGTLVNCTVTGNSVLSSTYNYGGGASYASLTNCIVYANREASTYAATSNYYSCTFTYGCSSPLPAGTGNLGTDPQLLPDGVHLAATSPCLGAGTASVISGTDIDGQPWNNPPAIGCDEWQPAPVIGAQPTYQVGFPAHGLTFNVIVAGQYPFSYFWGKDGAPIQDDGHHSNSGTANLVVNNFGPDDAGLYQVVVSNAFGVVTSQVAQVVIHAVDAAGANPISPYSTWATTATNIQDAINIAAAGDIVLVTNGIYAVGGKSVSGTTNRVTLDKALTVTSVNGYAATLIQGAWDPVSTNGPGAVRCAYLTDGAALNGFTLENGATPSGGFVGDISDSGGGVFCTSTNAVVSNCFLTNNSSIFGGGICHGTLNNSLVIGNLGLYGGGAFGATLNNCTVLNNYCEWPYPIMGSGPSGGGTYDCVVRNSIVVNNYWVWPYPMGINNYGYGFVSSAPTYSYSCTYPLPSGAGNFNGNNASQQFLDLFHIATTSPCRGAGSAVYTSGTDLDGEPWANPPSMGCDEVIVSNLVGPLWVNILASQTNLLVSPPEIFRPALFTGIITGRASRVEWSFGDGPTITNSSVSKSHQWTNSGDYTVTFTAYNNDNPAGVSTNIVVHVLPPDAPQLQSVLLLTNGFQFQFTGQLNAKYTIQYATNLTPPVVWQTLRTITYSSGGIIQIIDPAWTNLARFYEVLAQ